MGNRMGVESILAACKNRLVSLGKYKYAFMVLVIGVCLMVFPFGETEEKTPSAQSEDDVSVEEKLEDILSRVDGVGAAKVLLSFKEGPRYTYQTDERSVSDDQEQEREWETVLVRDENGGESPVITQTTYPVYEGAIVVCEGADNPAVRLRVVNAVSDLTGLGSDKISVVKMKSN